MSAGNFLGTMFVSVAVGAMWVVLGLAIDKIGAIFNRSIAVLPTFQDAVNGFTLTQTIWMIIPIIIWVILWINYAVNEANEATGYV